MKMGVKEVLYRTKDFDWGTEPDTVRVTAVAFLAGARIIGG